MDFKTVVKKRSSVRSFNSKKVSNKKLKTILNLANQSPSAGNLQARRVIVVKNDAQKQKLAQLSNGQSFISQAPIVLIICAHPQESASKYGQRGRQLYALQDATIFTSYLQLSATQQGLATCWVGAFNEDKVKTALNIPQELKPVAIIPLGYSDQQPQATPRKSLSEIALEV